AILARSQIFTPDALLPVVFPLNIGGRTLHTVLAFYMRLGLPFGPSIFSSIYRSRLRNAKNNTH
ncbi:hypothetical protein, partial [Enterobacter hormaechei]